MLLKAVIIVSSWICSYVLVQTKKICRICLMPFLIWPSCLAIIVSYSHDSSPKKCGSILSICNTLGKFPIGSNFVLQVNVCELLLHTFLREKIP